MWIIKIIKIQCIKPPRILNEHWGIYSCLQILPSENWFQYIRRVYATAINFPCITFLAQHFISRSACSILGVDLFENRLWKFLMIYYFYKFRKCSVTVGSLRNLMDPEKNVTWVKLQLMLSINKKLVPFYCIHFYFVLFIVYICT